MSILVYTENWDGKFKKLSFELASYASELARLLNTHTVAVTIGAMDTDELGKLGTYGIQKIVHLENDVLKTFDSQVYAVALSAIASHAEAQVIVMADNNAGKSIAPRLSVRLKAAIASGVNQLPESVSPFIVKKRAFSGNAFARIALKTPVKLITLSQNSFDLVENPVNTTVEKHDPGIAPDAVKTRVKEVQKQSGKLLLSDAEVVVSGGRGMKSPDNWAPLVELAELLNGATACSRPVSDEGWRPHDEHTGQTGKIIAPNVYIAVGISGATQHLAGISSSKYIVAINTDKDAPIFEAAQYGIIGDASKVLPKLVEAVKAIKNA